MSLLSDFLYGAARGLPTVIDDVRAREREELRLRMIEEERERQRTQAEQMYTRGRNDRRSDLDEQRAFEQKKLEDERRRQMLGNQEFASGYAASRSGVSPQDALAVGQGRGTLTGEIEGAAPMDGVGPGAPTQGVDVARMKKVFSDFHAALMTVQQGSKASEVMGTLRKREEQQAFDALDDNGKEQWSKDKQRFDGKGKDPEQQQLVNDLYRARAEAAEAAARKSDRGPAPPTGTTKEEREQAALIKLFEGRADDARARLAKGGAKAAVADAQKAVNDAEAAVLEVIRTGKPPAKAATPKADPASSAPPVNMLKENVNTTFKNGEVWTLRGGQPVKVR